MMINGERLNDELVTEIGRFAILWNCFERFHCNNDCGPKAIKKVAPFLCVDDIKLTELAEVLNLRRSWFGQIVSDYVEMSLHPGNARQSTEEDKSLMEQFMEQPSNSCCGCLLVIHRIRNNLMHGLKCIEQLNDQLELFRAVNGVLESIK